MSQFQPPPTWALPVLVDELSGKAQFNPVWLKWFVDLTQLLDNAGIQAGGSIIHNGLAGLQGGTLGQFYHLTYAEYSTLALAGPGTVTSVALTTPTGLTTGGSPIIAAGTLAVTFTAGYAIPTTAKQTEWDTAFTDKLKWDGGATGLVAATGRTSLGATTVGAGVFTLTNPSAITFLRFNADNTSTALSAADFRTAISDSGGSVTSVAMSVPTGLAIGGSPVTTTGTLAVTFAAGYSIPTDAKQTEWDTAFTNNLRWDGGSTGLTAATGRTSLGATTVGAGVFTLTNPSAVTFPRFNADNTTTALNASDFRTAIGAGVGGGDVSGPASSVDSELALFNSTTGKIIKRASLTGIVLATSGVASAASPGDFPTLNQNTTGSAATLTTPRAINGTNFDGSAAITVTAAGSTLTGTVVGSGTSTSLNSTVLASSLTSVGTITTGVWNGTTIAIDNGGTGQTTKAPAFDALSPMTTGGDLLYGGASGTGTRLANGSAGQVLQSNGTTSAPSWVAAGGGGGGITWSVVTLSATMAVDTGSLVNHATNLITLTLPATSAVGKTVRVAGMNTGLWKIAQAASQYIKFGNQTTITGTSGSLASVLTYDAVELVCIVADLGWVVTSSVGNITVA